MTDAIVTHIEFDGREASAVHCITGDEKLRLAARAGIVLSAAALGTPIVRVADSRSKANSWRQPARVAYLVSAESSFAVLQPLPTVCPSC